jgi:hypothetical protein
MDQRPKCKTMKILETKMGENIMIWDLAINILDTASKA